MISKFFIERPVLANVLAILIVVIGLVSMLNLPVAQYPNVTPPTVQVTTRYPGASARTVVDTVALPIEQQVNGVEDMLYMQSTSAADGSYTLTVTFRIGVDLNFAQVLVQNRVSSALSSLPQAVQAQGVTVQKKSTAILMFVTLSSPKGEYDSLYLANYATISLRDELSRVPGVGSVNVFGAGQYSMRVWLDPNKLQARSLTPQDVIQALQGQSQQVTAGQIGMPPTGGNQNFQYTIDIAGRLSEVEQYENVVVKTGDGAGGQLVRIKDIGRVELGAQTYSQIFTQDGQPAAALGIFQTPGANALQVRQLVAEKMADLARAFPPGVQYQIPFDTTKFVNASINEVYRTLIEAAVLVLIWRRRWIEIAILFAALSGSLMYAWMASQGGSDDSGPAGTGSQQVVVARQAIQERTAITSDMLQIKSVSTNAVVTGAFTDVDSAVGKVTKLPIEANAQVVASAVIDTSRPTADQLAQVVPTGKRGFSIDISEVTAAGGLILPDHKAGTRDQPIRPLPMPRQPLAASPPRPSLPP